MFNVKSYKEIWAKSQALHNAEKCCECCQFCDTQANNEAIQNKMINGQKSFIYKGDVPTVDSGCHVLVLQR